MYKLRDYQQELEDEIFGLWAIGVRTVMGLLLRLRSDHPRVINTTFHNESLDPFLSDFFVSSKLVRAIDEQLYFLTYKR